MKKRYKFVSLAILIIISGAIITFIIKNNNDIKSKNGLQNNLNINNKNVISILNTNFSKNTQLERKYSSPDGKNYIKQVSDGRYDDTGDIYIKYSLNNYDEVIDEAYIRNIEEFSDNKIKPEWIDNNRVVIDGRYIYYIDENKKQQIVDEDNWIVSYSINADRSKIAYYLCKNYELKVFMYDIVSGNKKTLYTQKIGEDINEEILDSIGTVLWDINNNIYFGSISSLEEGNLSSIINKYNFENKSIEEFSENKYLLGISGDKKFLAVRKDDGISIIDCITLNNYEIGNVNDFYWNSCDNTFVFTIKKKIDTIFLGNANTLKIEERNVRSMTNLDDKYKVFNLQDDNGEFKFDFIKYNDSEGIIIDVITYSLNS